MSYESETPNANPFLSFINDMLNMDGVEGVTAESVTAAMREILQSFPPDASGSMWGEKLDPLQDALRVPLAVDVYDSLLSDNQRFANVNRADLELVMTLAVTLGFVCYNQLAARYGMTEEREDPDLRLAKRLRAMLNASLGWVNKAAREGDPVAQGMMKDAVALLDETKRFGK